MHQKLEKAIQLVRVYFKKLYMYSAPKMTLLRISDNHVMYFLQENAATSIYVLYH